MMKRKVVNLKYYRKFRPVKRKIKTNKSICKEVLDEIKRIFID